MLLVLDAYYHEIRIWERQVVFVNNSPQKGQHTGDKGGKLAAKKNADAFPVHVMGVSRASIVDADSWYCDIGVTRHIMQNKEYFMSHKIRQSWNDCAWQEKYVMQA